MMVKYGGNGCGASGQQNSCINLDMEKNSSSRRTLSARLEIGTKSGDIGKVFRLGSLVGSCESRSQIRIWSKNVGGRGPRKDGQSLVTGGGD